MKYLVAKKENLEEILIMKNEVKERVIKENNIKLTKGVNKIAVPLEISNPQLWMPNGWGKPHLYNFTAQVVVDNNVIAEKSHQIGLRNIRVVAEPDEHGQSFYFEVNGEPMFAKGANYIPGEIMNTLQDDDYYERLFDNVVAGNMNMIRVWGGGFYENDKFYQLANEKGILRVQMPNKKIWINHKRVKLHVAASQLYPEDYDFSIIFESVKNRKIKHDMSRKFVEDVIIEE